MVGTKAVEEEIGNEILAYSLFFDSRIGSGGGGWEEA